MLINELPDECLLIIFNYLNKLDDLINCYKVCVKWSYLITERTRKVKCLIDKDITSKFIYVEGDPDDSLNCVYTHETKLIDGTVLSKLFGNLEILDCSHEFTERSKSENIVDLVKNQKSIKGLMYECFISAAPIAKYCNQLEMISCDNVEEIIAQNGSKVKQLHLRDNMLGDFEFKAHNFPNLERLYIHNHEGNPDNYYNGPIMEKLNIVQLALSSYDGCDFCYSFQFMDCCPSLKSAHIFVASNYFFVDESVKLKCLQDLVLSFFDSNRIDWNELKRLFMKYPNLKHLALRDDPNIKDEQIEHLVQVLPNLVLFDVRGCPEVTQSAANYVQDYCKRYGRSIKFYFDGNQHEMELDWPQLSTKNEKISRGYDFMKHCFLKDFYSCPVFLVPIDY